MKLVGRAAAIRAFLASYRRDVQGTIQFKRQALDNLPKQDLTMAQHHCHCIRGCVWYQRGYCGGVPNQI